MIAVGLGALASIHVGCSDLSTPADLDREQVLAVRATPSALVPGGSVHVELLLAGPTGESQGVSAWEVRGDLSGLEIESLDTGDLLIHARKNYGGLDPLTLDLGVTLPNGEQLWALKEVAIAAEEVENPEILGLQIDGARVVDEETVLVQGDSVPLVVDAPDATRFAWYTSVGEIRYYRDASTRLELPVEPWQSGWVAVVVRDEFGGANWQTFHLRSQ